MMTCISKYMLYIKVNKKKQGDCNKLYYYNILNVL